MSDIGLQRPNPALRDLPPSGGPRAKTLVSRAFRRRCPQCGAKGIFKNYLEMKERCPNCDYRFDREEGYFLGSYALNMIAAEFIPVGLLIWFLIKTDYSWVTLELIFIPMAVIVPFLTFPFSRTFWMALDLIIDPNEHTEKQLRRSDIQRS
jgi:uncharacterized protein (DUF983 family)